MFTGIVESLGIVKSLTWEKSNLHISIESNISNELKIDQSVAHNGVCLTVVAIEGKVHTVTAIQETLDKTNLSEWELGSVVNLERCMVLGGRLDGHIVQGHVDTTGICSQVKEENGSWSYRFTYDPQFDGLVISKGSICINGASLTVVDPKNGELGVAIIPYTHEHTNFHKIEVGQKINLEFDILGKYILKNLNK